MGTTLNVTDPKNPSGAFRCQFANCNASYRRKQHLNRHETKHTQQDSLPCSTCSRTFKRSDTLKRHVRRDHKIIEPLKRALRACKNCHATKSRCEGGAPCDWCLHRNIECSLYDHSSSVERQGPEHPADSASSPRHEELDMAPSEKRAEYIRHYFENFHSHWSFIHKGSFDLRHETPLLVQSMVVIGMWVSGDQYAKLAAVELHDILDLAIRDQRDKWDGSETDEACSAYFWPMPTFQAILLHIIFSSMLKEHTLDLDLKFSLSIADFELLQALIRTCRRLGMFEYPNILSRYKDATLTSFIWVGIEEIKRFNIALYKVCARSSSSVQDGDTKDYGDGLEKPFLAAHELQFPLPSSSALWNAAGKAEWMIHGKGIEPVSLDDYCEESWISNFAKVLEFLDP
ncbi:hypothetical protein N7520_002207 [Penicillium odoratum]|uniref:uncharacterized protein n=1 Tax=Penicillium odoratum TaxID=1167516 RepID=UPI0025492085|nr:uncharacterized protein N7520_002207 [Penicillium odoratum]KAJ5771678.1 hypothetical protein N7520_002207 [Penicillium odoratum]